MNVLIASASNAESLIADLRGNPDPAIIVFFASPRHSLAGLSAAIRNSFPHTANIGCTTAGELVSRSLSKGSIVAMALPADIVTASAVTVIEDLHDPSAIRNGLESLAQELGSPLSKLDQSTHVGLILVDGLSGAEESVIETIGDLTDLSFVGGSAGDDLAFRATLVAANGRTFEHAAVLAMLRVPAGFHVIKTQSFRSLGRILTADSVDEATRTVHHFNGLPARDAYAKALGIAPESVGDHFMSNPLGLMVGDEPFVRSPQRVLDDGSIVFYCQIREGMELELLESTDIITDTKNAIAGPHRALLVFNCILRTLELQQKGLCDQYGAVFDSIPSVGFSTYGEAWMGHINQTATMLAFE